MSERATYKVRVFINRGNGHLAGAWRHGLTDSDVFKLRQKMDEYWPDDASKISTGFVKTPEHPHGTAFRYAREAQVHDYTMNAVAWIVREYKD